MKVSTEACLFGAVVGTFTTMQPNRILDIGTGTGLLTLMLAQRFSHAMLTAIEIEPHAFQQANENFRNAPWSDRMICFHGPIQEFTGEPFDLVVCNPPFYSGHLQSPDEQRNKAIHNDALPANQLVCSIACLLAKEGEAWVLYPPQEMKTFCKQAKMQDLFMVKQILFHKKMGQDPFRIAAAFRHEEETNIEEKSIYIQDHAGSYTPEFTLLLKEYYLK